MRYSDTYAGILRLFTIRKSNLLDFFSTVVFHRVRDSAYAKLSKTLQDHISNCNHRGSDTNCFHAFIIAEGLLQFEN